MRTILIILAAICFALDALRIPAAVSWTPAGFALLTVALLLV